MDRSVLLHSFRFRNRDADIHYIEPAFFTSDLLQGLKAPCLQCYSPKKHPRNISICDYHQSSAAARNQQTVRQKAELYLMNRHQSRHSREGGNPGNASVAVRLVGTLDNALLRVTPLWIFFYHQFPSPLPSSMYRVRFRLLAMMIQVTGCFFRTIFPQF